MTPARAAVAGCGVAIMGFAVAGAATDPDLNAAGALAFLAAALIAHDALWMPAVLVAGVALTRVTPRRYRRTVQAVAIITAALGVLAFPLVLGVGRAGDNPSVQPLPYGRNLALVVILVAGGPLLAALVRRVRTRRSRRP